MNKNKFDSNVGEHSALQGRISDIEDVFNVVIREVIEMRKSCMKKFVSKYTEILLLL